MNLAVFLIIYFVVLIIVRFASVKFIPGKSKNFYMAILRVVSGIMIIIIAIYELKHM
ncbi:hypothetical protein [Ruminococcus albus]|nr:hypothetical protein [Ruminococcus albus]